MYNKVSSIFFKTEFYVQFLIIVIVIEIEHIIVIMMLQLLLLIDILEVLMGTIKALIVGVSDYTVINAPSLDLCLNDIFAFEKALIEGLNAKSENIYIYGKSKTVTVNDFIGSFQSIIGKIDDSDTLILSNELIISCIFISRVMVLNRIMKIILFLAMVL